MYDIGLTKPVYIFERIIGNLLDVVKDVLDMIHRLSTCLPYEVVREKEFAPIKNPTGIDSVESARELLKLNGVEL